LKFIEIRENTKYNFAYFPIILESEESLLRVKDSLNDSDIFPRRYFYPSLNSLDFLAPENMPISDDISKRVLCLPLAYDLSEEIINQITKIIIDNINE
jgi:dTDP-4-amino-4,6-dideoxygalactose transaminase